MTAQVADSFIYQDSPFHLVAYSNGELFHPEQYGYRPFPASTACWRGYCCEYTLVNEQLVLNQLHINHGDVDASLTQQKPPPDLYGTAAAVSSQAHIGKWLFDAVGLPLDYTGGLVIGEGFIRSLYVHMGFNPAWKYETVHELVFESGQLIQQSDLSNKMAEVREKLAKIPPEVNSDSSTEQIESWINNCFRRDYRQ